MKIKETMALANKLASVLNGEHVDNIIPSLVMVLHHASKQLGIPGDVVVGFVEKAFSVECPDKQVTKH